MFLLSQIIPFFVVSLLLAPENERAIAVFLLSFFPPFNLYTVIKCLKPLLIKSFNFLVLSMYPLAQSFVYFCCFVFGGRVPFIISCKAGLVVMNSLTSRLSGKVFISPSFLNDKFAV